MFKFETDQNNKGPDQIVWLRKLVWAVAVRIQLRGYTSLVSFIINKLTETWDNLWRTRVQHLTTMCLNLEQIRTVKAHKAEISYFMMKDEPWDDVELLGARAR